MTEGKLFMVAGLAMVIGACSVFGTPHTGPCGICEPITIYGQNYELCGKPTELARLKATLATEKDAGQ